MTEQDKYIKALGNEQFKSSVGLELSQWRKWILPGRLWDYQTNIVSIVTATWANPLCFILNNQPFYLLQPAVLQLLLRTDMQKRTR
jgi:hypothetical protein